MVVMAILAILITMGWMAWHNQIDKARDAQRKDHLNRLKISFEDFYNDKKCYPKPSEVCYNDTGGTTCNICGKESISPSFSPYLSHLPCDPSQPAKIYLYQVDSISCPKWYRVYAVLANTSDPVIAEIGCQNGCGPTDDKNYNYGVTSPNTGLEKNVLDQYACFPSGCVYCCGGVDCETLCSTIPSDYCNNNVYITNSFDTCTINCPCP